MEDIIGQSHLIAAALGVLVLGILYVFSRKRRLQEGAQEPNHLDTVRRFVTAGKYEKAGELQEKFGHRAEAYNLYKRGNIHSKASLLAEKMGWKDKAAFHAEHNREYARGAELYEACSDYKNASRCFREASMFERAAEALVQDLNADPLELAQLWELALSSLIPHDSEARELHGEALELLFERAGKAADAYQKAGDYERAAQIYEKCQKHDLAMQMRKKNPQAVLERLGSIVAPTSSSVPLGTTPLPQIPQSTNAHINFTSGEPGQAQAVLPVNIVSGPIPEGQHQVLPTINAVAIPNYQGENIPSPSSLQSLNSDGSHQMHHPGQYAPSQGGMHSGHFQGGPPSGQEMNYGSGLGVVPSMLIGDQAPGTMKEHEIKMLSDVVNQAVQEALQVAPVQHSLHLSKEVSLEAIREHAGFSLAGSAIQREIIYVPNVTGESDTPIQRESDRYTIKEMLGEGGMAVVYRAIDSILDREVALKFLPENLAKNITALELFEREAKAAAGLSHPNIVTIYDFGILDSRPFICMELVGGSSVEDLIKNSDGFGLPLIQALDIVEGVLMALEQVHNKQLVHRDIKPANVMLTSHEVVKLMDFGVVTVIEPGHKTKIAGTPFYMAPEQLTGQWIDHRTDLFSLGVMMYELVTGELPFEGIMRWGTPKEPISFRNIPRLLNKLIMWCLEFEAEKRPQNAKVLLYAVKKLRSHVIQYLSINPALEEKQKAPAVEPNIVEEVAEPILLGPPIDDDVMNDFEEPSEATQSFWELTAEGSAETLGPYSTEASPRLAATEHRHNRPSESEDRDPLSAHRVRSFSSSAKDEFSVSSETTNDRLSDAHQLDSDLQSQEEAALLDEAFRETDFSHEFADKKVEPHGNVSIEQDRPKIYEGSFSHENDYSLPKPRASEEGVSLDDLYLRYQERLFSSDGLPSLDVGSSGPKSSEENLNNHFPDRNSPFGVGEKREAGTLRPSEKTNRKSENKKISEKSKIRVMVEPPLEEFTESMEVWEMSRESLPGLMAAPSSSEEKKVHEGSGRRSLAANIDGRHEPGVWTIREDLQKNTKGHIK